MFYVYKMSQPLSRNSCT